MVVEERFRCSLFPADCYQEHEPRYQSIVLAIVPRTLFRVPETWSSGDEIVCNFRWYWISIIIPKFRIYSLWLVKSSLQIIPEFFMEIIIILSVNPHGSHHFIGPILMEISIGTALPGRFFGLCHLLAVSATKWGCGRSLDEASKLALLSGERREKRSLWGIHIIHIPYMPYIYIYT